MWKNLVRGSFSGGEEQKFPLKHQGPKISQISPVTQWHNYAHFWYSKVDLDWIGTSSKISFAGGGCAEKQQNRESLNRA
jgi:hypothetical protein